MSALRSRAIGKVRSILNGESGLVTRVSSAMRARRGLPGAARNGLDSGADGTPVFFVVGYQKSGTTWLMKMLDAHHEVLCDGEGRPFGRDWRQENLKEKKMSYPPTSLYNAVMSAEDLRYWVERSVWTKRGDTEKQLKGLTRLAIEHFLVGRLAGTGKRLVGDKTVLHEPGIVREIADIFPDARVIHIVRDGRDVAVSTAHQRWNQAEDRGGNVVIDPEEARRRELYHKDPAALLASGEGIFTEGWMESRVAKWAERVRSAAQDGPKLLGPRYAEVRYEDLLVRPEREMARLFGLLGVEAGEETVKRCVDAASFSKLAGGRERGEEAASFFRKGIAGDWKNVFTPRDKAGFKATAGDLLVELGYEEDDDW